MSQSANFCCSRLELPVGQSVAEAARAAVRKERDVAVVQAEDLRGRAAPGRCRRRARPRTRRSGCRRRRSRAGRSCPRKTCEAVAAADAARRAACASASRVSSWPSVVRVFAARGPLGRDAESLSTPLGCAFGDDTLPERMRRRSATLAHCRWPRPAPVGVRSQMASMSARRVGLSIIASAGRSSCSRLIEHLMSTPTGPG